MGHIHTLSLLFWFCTLIYFYKKSDRFNEVWLQLQMLLTVAWTPHHTGIPPKTALRDLLGSVHLCLRSRLQISLTLMGSKVARISFKATSYGPGNNLDVTVRHCADERILFFLFKIMSGWVIYAVLACWLAGFSQTAVRGHKEGHSLSCWWSPHHKTVLESPTPLRGSKHSSLIRAAWGAFINAGWLV